MTTTERSDINKMLVKHARRHTINPSKLPNNIYKLDMDLGYLDIQNVGQAREVARSKIEVKSFLKNCYNKYTHVESKPEKENFINSAARRNTTVITPNQKDMLKLSLHEEVIEEQKNDHATDDVITAREENEQVTDEEQNSGVINLSINHQKDEALRQTSATYDSRENHYRKDALTKEESEEVKNMHERRRSKYNIRRAKPREQQPVSISYNYASNSLEQSSTKKKNKLNSIIARLSKQTESSGRKANRDQSGDDYGLKKTNTHNITFYKPYKGSTADRKQRTRKALTKSVRKGSAKPAPKVEKNHLLKNMNILIKMQKRVHDVNVKKGKLYTYFRKNPSDVTKQAEMVINEQSGVIDEYHSQLRGYIEKNESLTKQIQYFKKERMASNSKLNSSTDKIDRNLNSSALKIQENSFDQVLLSDYKTPGKISEASYY
ncbi:unnamed protein product [Moneuplotes crassus]|uniref:Uncharacterized protein n=1 Tax=Euplotes crassus TaxID=5936 RepID=A0AAD1UHA0_EUPCR|nr:unnamed protein product [Moneuplotes crassus]